LFTATLPSWHDLPMMNGVTRVYCKSASGQSVQSICLAQRIKENGVRGVCWVCKQSASSFRLEKASHPVLSYIVPWGNLELCYEQAKGSSCHTKEDSLSMSCDILSYQQGRSRHDCRNHRFRLWHWQEGICSSRWCGDHVRKNCEMIVMSSFV
jgi:hypothetical protein